MSAITNVRIAFILCGLFVSGVILFYEDAVAFALNASNLAQQPTKIDCAPHWSLNLVTDTNKVADQGLLNSLGVVSQNDIWAVGYMGSIVGRTKPLAKHWDGVRWNTILVPSGSGNQNDLAGIATLAPNDIWAVGASGPVLIGNGPGLIISVPLIEHWDGLQWSIVPSPRPVGGSWLKAVSAIGPKDIWAVGYYTREEDSWDRPLALHWNGTDWKQVVMPSLSSPSASSSRLYAVAAINSDDVWAAGTENLDGDAFGGDTLIVHWDGKGWTEYPSLPLGHLLAVKAVSSTEVWAVGYETNLRRHMDFYMNTLIVHWNGNQWSRVPSPDPVDNLCVHCNPVKSTLHGIIVVSPKEIWALGSPYNGSGIPALALKWNGSVWSITPAPVMGYSYEMLNAVDTSPGEGVGGSYQPVAVPPTNGKCAAPSSPSLNPTSRVSNPRFPNITYFAAVGHTLRGGFRDYWEQHGGLAQFGYPITEEFQEGGYTVQYFERARFEWHPERAPQSRVQQDVLASELIGSRNTSEPFQPHLALQQASTGYYPGSLHNLAPQFASYWQSHGGAALYGYPISEAFQEVNAADGKPYLVQYFPRQRFEYHPELPEPYTVSLGLVGVEFARQQGWLP